MSTEIPNHMSDDPESIFPYSWWGDMNYYLSAIPFLGALNSGILGPVSHPVLMLKPSNASSQLQGKFCESVADCSSRFPELMSRWTLFFQLMRKKKSLSRPAIVPGPSPTPQQDAMLSHLWAGHTKSIETGVWVCGCVGGWVGVWVGGWVCRWVGVWVGGCVGVWVGVWVCGWVGANRLLGTWAEHTII